MVRCCACFLSIVLFLSLPAAAGFAQTPAESDHAAPNRGTVSVVRLRIPQKARDEMALALASLRHQDPGAARRHANVALALSPDFPDALSFRGYLELEAEQFDDALKDLQRAVAEDPNFGIAYLHLGVALNHFGRFDEALAVLRRNAEFQPNTWQCPFEMAKAWLGKHDYPRSLEAVNRAASLGGGATVGAAIHFIRGNALAGMKQYDSARAELQACLTAEANSGLADLARERLETINRDVTLATK